MSNIRPLPWLGRGYHNVDVLCTLGYQATQAAINLVSCTWTGNDEPDRQLHNELIPNENVFRYLKENDQLPSAPLLPESLVYSILEPCSRPVPLMNPHDLTGWWSSLVKLTICDFSSSSGLLNKPDYLVRAGYSLLRDVYFEAPDENHALGACLSMIGAGAMALFTARPCNLCHLRRSSAGSLRCMTCSRSKKIISTSGLANQSASANRIRRVHTHANLAEISFTPELHSSFSRLIAALLFSMKTQGEPHRKWLTDVTTALAKAPAISKLVGTEFSDESFAHQTQKLRDIIDQNEWDYGLWPEKILKAQSWLEAAELVRQRRRGPGPMGKTLDLAQRAKELLAKGMSKNEVANVLGISPSNLSHVLRRTSSMD